MKFVIMLIIFLASPAWAANTLTWTRSPDAAFHLIEKRTLTGQYPNRAYDFVGPEVEMFVDDRTDTRPYCYRITGVGFSGVRSIPAEVCMNIGGNSQ
jgi:hypothetical protein